MDSSDVSYLPYSYSRFTYQLLMNKLNDFLLSIRMEVDDFIELLDPENKGAVELENTIQKIKMLGINLNDEELKLFQYFLGKQEHQATLISINRLFDQMNRTCYAYCKDIIKRVHYEECIQQLDQEVLSDLVNYEQYLFNIDGQNAQVEYCQTLLLHQQDSVIINSSLLYLLNIKASFKVFIIDLIYN